MLLLLRLTSTLKVRVRPPWSPSFTDGAEMVYCAAAGAANAPSAAANISPATARRAARGGLPARGPDADSSRRTRCPTVSAASGNGGTEGVAGCNGFAFDAKPALPCGNHERSAKTPTSLHEEA